MIAPTYIPALDDDFRASVHRAYGATPSEIAELVEYARCPFDPAALSAPASYPLPDEPFVAAWEAYVKESSRIGAAAALRARLVQLRFPIQRGISQTDAYRAATRRGEYDARSDENLPLRHPDGLVIMIAPTAAGHIATIVSDNRDDFESLVRALTRRNEPEAIPKAIGAAMVAGYNNWDRVARLRAQWAAGRPGGDDADAWRAEFATLVAKRELYQDRFIVLSTGPYSGVPADAVGMADADWRTTSLVIRQHHECAHYFTRRAFGSMKNTLVDETIADYMGIVAAIGRFRADWLLLFLGVARDGSCRADGRLHNYRGAPPLSDGAFAVLRAVVVRAADALETFDGGLAADAAPRPLAAQALAITALARVGLEGLASTTAARLLRDASAAPEEDRLDGRTNPHPAIGRPSGCRPEALEPRERAMG
jgi:hypothetical protein